MKIKLLLLVSAIFTLLLIGCKNRGRGNDSNNGVQKNDSIPIVGKNKDSISIKPVIKVYIENSASMDGYVNGNTEFKGSIRDLLVLMKYHYGESEKIKIHFINKIIRETDLKKDLVEFTQNINQVWRDSKDNRSSSNLNNVYNMILEKTDSSTISILFSDCIYSIKGEDAEELLADEKSLTKDAFLSRWRKDQLQLATSIVKMNSSFNGIYYDKNNKKTQLNNKLRPYYITIIGNNALMSDFYNKIPFDKENIEGFDNKYIISSGGFSKEPYFSILLSTDNNGKFKRMKKMSSKEYVHGIEDIKLNKRGRNTESNNKLSFAVAIDMNDIPVQEDYLSNPENYLTSDDNFIIKDVKKINKNEIGASDWITINHANPTHLIIVEATGTAVSDFSISLKKQMPKWIEETNIINDNDINRNLNKTFGIKYLIEGVAEAYDIIYPDEKEFFEIKLKIKK